MPEQDLLGLHRIGGVGRVGDQRLAADVGEGVDALADDEFVGAAVAAADDHDVDLGDLDHGERVVDRGLHHLELAVGEAVALRPRAFGELELQLDAVLGEDALLDADEERQRARGRKCVEPD